MDAASGPMLDPVSMIAREHTAHCVQILLDALDGTDARAAVAAAACLLRFAHGSPPQRLISDNAEEDPDARHSSGDDGRIAVLWSR